jgi:hypothetical protein
MMARAGWRALVSAKQSMSHERLYGLRYAVDNGAWSAYQRGEPFDTDAFNRVVDRMGADADWVVVPDVVGNMDASLDFTAAWLPRLQGLRLLVAAQDGMGPQDVEPFIAQGAIGVFLGGGTEYKLATARHWGDWCHARGLYFHLARVNSAKRIRLCYEARAHSFDGSSVSKFSKTIWRLDAAMRQQHLWSVYEFDGNPAVRMVRGASDSGPCKVWDDPWAPLSVRRGG